MEISSASVNLPTGPVNADVQQAVTLRLLKESIELQGQLALSLLPQPVADPDSSLGHNIDIRV